MYEFTVTLRVSVFLWEEFDCYDMFFSRPVPIVNSLPFYINITHLLSSYRRLVQNNITCIPDNHPKYMAIKISSTKLFM